MRKKITKMIENILPRLFDSEGNIFSKQKLANQILDSIPHVERLDLIPFETWIPFVCSTCKYNSFPNKLGCTYELTNEVSHMDNPAPNDCPMGYGK